MARLSHSARLYLVHIALLTFGLAISGLFFNLTLVALGYDQRTLRLPLLGDLALLGLLNSLPVLAAALSSMAIWRLLVRVGLRAALLIATVMTAAQLFCVALWPTPLLLLLGAALSGPAAVLFQLSAAPLMMRLSGAQGRDTLFSTRFGLTVGMAGVGTLIGGLLPGLAARLLPVNPQSAESYRVAFVLAALIVLAAVVPLLALRVAPAEGEPAPAAAPPRAGLGELRRIFASGPWAMLRLLISPLLISCGASLLVPYMNLFFRQRHGAPDAALGLIFAAIGVATGAAALLAPRLSARIGKPRSFVITQALAIPCLLLMGMAPSLWAASAMGLLRGALMNMATPLYEAYAMEQSSEEARPIISGLLAGAYAVAYIIGPTLSAQIQRAYGFAPIFVATAICYSLAVTANYLLFVRGRRTAEQADLALAE